MNDGRLRTPFAEMLQPLVAKWVRSGPEARILLHNGIRR